MQRNTLNLKPPDTLGMEKRIHSFKIAAMVILCAGGLYLASFVWRFDILGAPVRSSSGWLGPLPRGDSNAVDIGKVWYSDSPDTSLYQAYQPLCRLWLWVEGLSMGSR